MNPTLVELASKWQGGVGHMPALETEIARPSSDDPLGDLDRILQAAAHDLRICGLVERAGQISTSQEDAILQCFGWLVATLREWTAADDPHGRRLSGALAVTAAWDADGNSWRMLAPLVGNATRLTAALTQVLGSRRIEAVKPLDVPLSEREQFDRFTDADRHEDWTTLAEMASGFQLPHPDFEFTQAARALYAIDSSELAAMLHGCSTWFDATHLLAALGPTDVCRIAIESRAPRVRFAALERLANRLQRDLSQDENEALRDLFSTMAADALTWPVFMKAFNCYPTRYTRFQQPLGWALAEAPATAVQAYVDAIELTGGNKSAHVMVACLCEFRNRASKELRCALWTRAYERWDLWNFGGSDREGRTTITQSELDVAVLGWLLECAPREFVQTEIDEFASRLRIVEADWHASISVLKSAVSRLLSRYLLFSYAKAVSLENADWMEGRHIPLPIELTTEYATARYGSCWT